MLTVAPGATFEATVTASSGLTGTLGARIRDNVGSDFLARTTTGITADLTVGSTSVYRRAFTAPTVAGQYTVVWDDAATVVKTEELVVAYSAVTAGTGSVYATRDELKVALALQSQTYVDADIDRACAAASRAIDNRCGRAFYTTTETRYFTPNPRDPALDILDVQAISAFTVDIAGNGSFSTTWVAGTDFDLEPFNAAATGRPYELVRLRPQAGKRWPRYNRSVQVAGTFGWATIPDPVNQYALILASKLLDRARKSPNGVIVFGLEAPIATRISRNDPDFELLLGDYDKSSPGR